MLGRRIDDHLVSRMMMVSARVDAAMPEWEAFAHAVQARRPDAGTWCVGCTVQVSDEQRS